MSKMIKVLARSIREYKKASILTPLLVTVEVILECAIPFVIANLVNQMQAGCSMDVIVKYGLALIIMAIVSLIFGGLAGSTCATASAGFARNLRKDMFYKIQDYSFQNIDKFSVSSLVTRLTTDITNVQGYCKSAGCVLWFFFFCDGILPEKRNYGQSTGQLLYFHRTQLMLHLYYYPRFHILNDEVL